MALPKRRQSKARGRKRRTHYKANWLAPVPAPNVGKQKCHIEFAQIVDTIKEGLLYP